MKLRISSYFLLVCFMLFATSCSQNSKPVFQEYQTVFKIGDRQEWASKNLEDPYWEKRMALVPDGQVFWSRTKVDIIKAPEAIQPYGLRLEVYGEYEVFWDGVPIGKNGNPGQEAEMSPEGKLWTTFIVPTYLTNVGEHVVALRLSNYYYPDHIGNYDLKIDDYDNLLNDRLIQNSYMHVFAGAFLIAAIYFLFLFLGNKKEYPTLIFSISCLLFFGLTMTHFVRTTIPIHYSLHVVRLEVITSLMFGISFLIPLYFSMQFPYPKRKFFLGIYTIILLFIFSIEHHLFDYTILNMALSLLIFSMGVAVYGVYKKAKGAFLVLLTLLLCIFIRHSVSFNLSLFIGFSLILLNMLYLLSLRIKEQRLAFENSLLQSTRLRLELLKKNIQPHFIMNTLTSLIDWIEESPKKGVLFIEALAKEFDLLNQIENKTLILIEQEIALCRTHLEIMEYRKEVNYNWEEEGIDNKQKIPPGILHTLLENGITHSLPLDDNSIKFKLVFESNSDYKSYTFLTFAAAVRQEANINKEGTGLKYIKARLTESYHEQWDFTSEPVHHGWKSIIKLYS
ncbi:histidine kinase [Flagellimonas pacifica]|uniref:Sensor histidine kinase YesM n=1 Tax=Flagellimonas pacifica TaxID=1247520 RepID=A0A285MRY0_9FLAO|nr:histidine kinase [Allomuricauda parva]SNY99944.1 Sensor histidine kinase YesM [Allomuricauda parva]